MTPPTMGRRKGSQVRPKGGRKTETWNLYCRWEEEQRLLSGAELRSGVVHVSLVIDNFP